MPADAAELEANRALSSPAAALRARRSAPGGGYNCTASAVAKRRLKRPRGSPQPTATFRPAAAAPAVTSGQSSAQSVERSPSVQDAGDKGAARGRGDEVSAERSHGQRGEAKRESHAGERQGCGPIATPPADTPVRRGPPEAKAKPEHGSQAPKVDDEQGPTVVQEHGAQAEYGGHGQKAGHSQDDVEG